MLEPRFGKKRRADQVWRKELDGSGEVVIASPYLTGPLARKIVDLYRSAPEKLTIYTRFDLFDFVSKASSIEFLTYLVSKEFGCENVFEVEKLHAKLVRAPSFVTIGSQNVTQGSTRNIEASIVLRNGELAEAVDTFLAELDAAKKLITLDRCCRMLKEVITLRPMWGRFNKTLKARAAEFEQGEPPHLLTDKTEEDREKAEEERRRALEDEHQRWRSERIDEAITWLRNSQDVSDPRVMRKMSLKRGKGLQREDTSLNLRHWRLRTGEETPWLGNGKFYPIYELTRGTLAWVRVNDTHLGQFWTEFNVETQGLDIKKGAVGNVEVRLAGRLFLWWFGPGGSQVFGRNQPTESERKKVEDWLFLGTGWQRRKMGKPLGRPFDEVFDLPGNTVQIQLAKVQDKHILILRAR